MRLRTEALTTNQTVTKRIVLGFAALASAAMIGTITMAGATPNTNPPVTGYGGGNGNEINTEVNLEVNGDNNIINIILNYVVG